jgi:2-oxoisovalerate dehydrogenase E1 component alpha subunit
MALSNETLLEMYRTMLLARRLDERAWVLHRQGKIAFHISGIGQEAAQVGAVFALQRQTDWLVPYYRDLAMMLAYGLTPREFVLGLMGKRGIKLRGDQAVVLTSIGEGSTSQGEWYEGVNWAATQKLPAIFLVENNIYAISVRLEQQMAVAQVADKAKGLGLPGISVDGMDVMAMHQAVSEAVERARAGEGPTLVEARVYRLTPHSSDDDDRSYRSRQEVESWRERDPLLGFQQALRKQKVLTSQAEQELDAKAKEQVEEAVAFAEAAPYPEISEASYPVFAEDIRHG